MDPSSQWQSGAAAPTAPDDLRARRRQRTTADIERAALRLFREHGYDTVTVDDIAAASGISRRTFFRYFAAKEDVLFADQGERLDALLAALAARPVDEPAARALREAVLAVAEDHVAAHDLACQRRAIVEANPALAVSSHGRATAWEQEVIGMIAERLGVDPATDVRPGVIVASTLGALRVALRLWTADDRAGDLRALLTAALDVVDEGLAPTR